MEGGAGMEMAYRERWKAEIAEMQRVLSGVPMLGFFQGALLKDRRARGAAQ
jgi:hypothetical protein